MTIIDCHTHIGKNENINYSVDQLLRSMDKAHIDKSLVFAGELNDCSNDFLLKEILPHKDRLYGIAAFHPNQDNNYEIMKLKYLLESGNIFGVKFYLGYDYWYPTDEKIYSALNMMSAFDIPAIFHCGDCLNSVKGAKLKYAHPLGIDEVAVDFPDQKIVIAHLAYPWHRDAAEVVYKNKNVFTDISGFVYGNFGLDNERHFKKVLDEFVEISGNSDKILFGSDAPISNQDSYISISSNIFSNKIFEENPRKVFRI